METQSRSAPDTFRTLVINESLVQFFPSHGFALVSQIHVYAVETCDLYHRSLSSRPECAECEANTALIEDTEWGLKDGSIP